MKKLLVISVLLLSLVVIVFSFSEIETTMETIRKGHLSFFLLAVLVQIAWFATSGRMYKSIFHLLGIEETTFTLGKIAAAANFINVVAPSGGMGGVAFFASEAHRRGHPGGKATVAAALFLLMDQASFMVILTLGLAVLARRNDLDASEISASLILVSIAMFYSVIFYLGYRSEQRLGDLLERLSKLINRIVGIFSSRKEFLREARAREFAHEIADGLEGLKEKPSSLIRPVLWGILDKVLLMGILMLSFLSFEIPFSAGTIIAGFSLAYLFLIVSPTPSGIGIVEGLMPIGLGSLNVDWNHAVLVTLTYRAITFWVPFGVGALAFRSLHSVGEEPHPEL